MDVATASELISSGALPMLVGLIDKEKGALPPVVVVRGTTRALANIACSSRRGTVLGEMCGLGGSILSRNPSTGGF